MDGLPDATECAGDISTCPDTDGDGDRDYLDPDDDDDGVPTSAECAMFGACDTDGDGFDDHHDVDADDDGITDGVECTAGECPDTDGDGAVDRVDTDADGDGISDRVEGHDADMNGVPDAVFVGMDTDGDGLDDAFDADDGGSTAPIQDTDGDRAPDWRDPDDDDDGVATNFECADPTMTCPDSDADTTPDYLDPDSAPTDRDMDGIPDVVECPPPGDPVGDLSGCPDSDGDGRPDADDPDDDNDGIPTADENYDGDKDPTDDDSDRDGRPDYLDPDDDDDTIPTADECPDFVGGCPDSDGDRRPDYLDVCGDGTRTVLVPGVTAWEECDDGNAIAGDGCDPTCRLEPATTDGDDDMDGLLNSEECPAPGDVRDPMTCRDTDGDGMPDFRDPDDDDDTIPTRTEIADSAALSRANVDVDRDGNPNWLDTDADGDGIPDMDEPNDDDGNGVPDYLEPAAPTPSRGGFAGGALCSASSVRHLSDWPLGIGFALALIAVRRRRFPRARR